jgi:hypothetical protein
LREPGNRYRFNGKEFVEEIGLYEYGFTGYDQAGDFQTFEAEITTIIFGENTSGETKAATLYGILQMACPTCQQQK